MNKVKIYLASAFKEMQRMREYAKILRTNGHEITSSWLRERLDPKSDLDVNKDYTAYAIRDIEEIIEADAIIVFTVDPEEFIKRGGKHFEAGVAYALKKKLYFIGPTENIFYYLPEWKHFNTFEQFLNSLEEE